MKRAVITDIDGTLLRSADVDDQLYRQAVRRVLGDVRLRPDLHSYRRVTDTGILLQILEDNSLPVADTVVADVKAEFFAAIDDHIQTHGPFDAVPGARQFIARLRQSGRTEVAIATGGWRRSAQTKLASAGFDVTDVPFASSDDAIERTEIMRIALDFLEGPFTSVTYYGDADWDRKASLELGWQFRAVGPALDGIETFDTEQNE